MMMAIVAIIGILAEVALSAYEDYVARAQATEAATSQLKIKCLHYVLWLGNKCLIAAWRMAQNFGKA